jgi:hypothetical protein
MTISEARKWLGVYFLLVTCITGAIILLLGGGTFIPLEEADVNHSFQILIPVLLGQVTVIFQWIARQGQDAGENDPCPIPAWAIRLPPISAAAIICLSVLTLVISNRPDMRSIRYGPERFMSTLTFAVSILNASTVFLVSRLFPSTERKSVSSSGESGRKAAQGS